MPPSVLHLFVVAPALALLTTAAIWDARSRRIPNWLCSCLALFGVAHAGSTGGVVAGLAAAGAGAFGFALLFVPWRAGLMGGGDLKLLAASGTWLGFVGVVELMLYSAVAGGVLAVAFLLRAPETERATVRANLSSVVAGGGVSGLRSRGRGVPYGIAIAVAAATMIVWRTR